MKRIENIKRLNIVVILFLIFLLFLIQPSFSYFKLTKENPDAIVLETVELSYTITSSSLSNNQMTIPENSIQQIVIELVSGNSRETEYEVYYQILGSLSDEEKKNIAVNCIENESKGLPSGTISSSGTKELVIVIENKNDDAVTIEIGCQGGLVGRDLVLEQGETIPVISTALLVDVIKEEAVLDNIASTYVTNPTGIDFSQISSDTNGKGLYILHGTESDEYPIMYYRGAVENNNVKFANLCWKMVRTTETGGVKLIYNGVPDENGACTATGSFATIGDSAFNSARTDNTYVGYMYGKAGSNVYEETHANIHDSVIKGVIDKWYEENMTSYTDKLEDAIWCNDRSTVPDNNYPGSGAGTETTSYGARNRLINNKLPILECVNENDRFTVSAENGNGALTYPVALLTADEKAYAGAVFPIANTSYYLYHGDDNCWLLSPYFFYESTAYGFAGFVKTSVNLYANFLTTPNGVRPTISLKSGTKIIYGGEGTIVNPYIVM